MVLDINVFRTDRGGNPDLVRESQKRRFGSVDLVDQVIEADNLAKSTKHKWEMLKAELGKLQKEIGQRAKEKKPFDDLKEKKSALEADIKAIEPDVEATEKARDKLLNVMGNIVHDSVKVSKNEDDNEIVKTWGTMEKKEKFLHHYDVLAKIDGYEPERGVKVSGNRGYFLKGMAFRLNQALVNYGTDFLCKRGFTPILTPFFMNKDVMAATAQLEDFDEQLYKVIASSRPSDAADANNKHATEDDEKYLIATSEQPISAMHKDEYIDEEDLPIKYAGYSSCFRKEAGSVRDGRGIFRVHQFEKIEQFCITTPDKSWEMHEEMLKASEDFYQSLGIPYRVVVIVSGALNNAASKKYDLEGFFPAFGECRELVSCSNCTDYQSRSLNVRFRAGSKKDAKDNKNDKSHQEAKFVHMLNSTLTATTRTLSCILENHQNENGVVVPEVLRPYIGGIDFIPWVQKTKKH